MCPIFGLSLKIPLSALAVLCVKSAKNAKPRVLFDVVILSQLQDFPSQHGHDSLSTACKQWFSQCWSVKRWDISFVVRAVCPFVPHHMLNGVEYVCVKPWGHLVTWNKWHCRKNEKHQVNPALVASHPGSCVKQVSYLYMSHTWGIKGLLLLLLKIPPMKDRQQNHQETTELWSHIWVVQSWNQPI